MKTRWVDIIIIVVVLLLIPLFLETFAAWDNANPTDAQTWNTAAATIRANWTALEVELGENLSEAHPYYQSAAPDKKPDTSTVLDVNDNGRLWVDSDDNTIYVLSDYSGPTWTSTAAATGLTEADAAFTLQNTDEEDSDGGRQSRFVSKGEQSGGQATTLGYIEFSHDGTTNDQKGQFVIKVNDGNDDDAPSKQAIGYLSTGKIDVSSSLSVLDEDDLSSDDDEVVPTQQSVKAYVDAQNMTPASYAGEESITFSNGFILKQGIASSVSVGDTTVEFDEDFPTAIINAWTTWGEVVSSDVENCGVHTMLVGSMKLRNPNSSWAGKNINWFAIGY